MATTAQRISFRSGYAIFTFCLAFVVCSLICILIGANLKPKLMRIEPLHVVCLSIFIISSVGYTMTISMED